MCVCIGVGVGVEELRLVNGKCSSRVMSEE